MSSRYTSMFNRRALGILSVFAVSAALLLNACGKRAVTPGTFHRTGQQSAEQNVSGDATTSGETPTTGKGSSRQVLTQVLTVAGIRPMGEAGHIEVFFNENAEFFTVTDPSLISTVKEALNEGKPLKVSFDPWQGELIAASRASEQETNLVKSRAISRASGTAMNIDFSKISDDVINEPSGMGVLNTTDPGLNNVIPDFATAQLMFDYITRQCCALPGPYGIDYCISFQYCQDGCYARAHKMCWIINNKYKYGTKKIFSFANSGSDKLCVQAQKWGGCCIRWWYHVAPLVTVQTPTGPKAYVFDAAMFNQPVLLATWLHAQENPACAGSWTPHVTMINVQPTSSYTPAGSSGMSFNTDPSYSSTNSVLSSYSPLVTCP